MRHVLALPTVLACLAGCATAAAADRDQQPRVNPQAQAVKAFADRTHAYMDLRATVAKKVPPVEAGDAPEQIERHRAALADALREARRGAHEGDLFTPDIAPQFRRIVRQDLASRDVRDALAAMQEVPVTLVVRVNDAWPADAPRATVPPRLLNNLYALPEGLEYRFLNRHLVLLDTEAELILDIVRNVVPSYVSRKRR